MIIGIDFETYYDADYSLTKMPTHQYVRDPRFRCLGCGFQFGVDARPLYVSDIGKVRAILDRIPWDRVSVVCHNAQFDGTILWERFGRKAPARWLDTQLMARWAIAQGHLDPNQGVSLAKLAPLVEMEKGDTRAAVDAGGDALAQYGTNDVRIMMALLGYFQSLDIPEEELVYMDMHVRMATQPVLDLDTALLAQAATQTEEQRRLHELLRKDANFKRVLEARGVEVEYKTTPKGRSKPAFAKADAFMRDLLNHEDPEIAELAELRLSAQSNIVRTRARRMLDVGDPLPVPLLYYAAHTGRSGGRDKLNPQNLPTKGPLRQAVMAPEGHSLVVGDSRQVEARVLGWRAGDENLLDTFKSTSPYRTFAGLYMYNCPPEDVTPEQYKVGKAGVLGLGFGQGVNGFINHCARSGVTVDAATAERAVQAYRQAFSRVPLWWREVERRIQEEGEIRLPSGRKLTYPGLHWGTDDEGRRQAYFDRHMIFSKARKGQRQRVKVWHGLLVENDTQAVARDVVFWQARRFAESGVGTWQVVWMTHDEVVAVVPDEAAEDCAECLLHSLRQVPPWAKGLPTDGEVHIVKRYGEVKG